MSGFCNVGAHMSLGKWWLWALLGLLALYLLMLFFNWRDIEGDIQGRTQAALNDNGHDWASIDQSNRGRDVLITGMAPDEGAVSEAVSLAQKVSGVRVVDSESSIIEWVSSQFSLSTEKDQTTLTGMLPDQPSIARVVQAVSNLVGAGNVDNKLQINTIAREAKWLDKVIVALPALGTLQNAELQAEDGVFSAAGDVKTDAEKNDIYALLSDSFGRDFNGRVNVTGPSAEELAAMAATKLADEQKRQAEAAAKSAEEQKRQEDAAAKLAEEQKRQAEAAAKLAEEQMRQEEAAAKLAEEQKRQAEAAAKLAEEQMRQAEAAVMAAEEKKRSEEAAAMAAAKVQRQKQIEQKLKLDRSMFLDSCQSRFNETVQAKNIQFATASATISTQSFPILKSIISLIQECNLDGGLKIEITGHTDDTGNDSANLVLSEARANSVLQYLLQSGVGQNILSAKGYGESRPIADNASAEGRAQNRRIQFNIQR